MSHEFLELEKPRGYIVINEIKNGVSVQVHYTFKTDNDRNTIFPQTFITVFCYSYNNT